MFDVLKIIDASLNVMKVVGQRWKSLTPQEKKVFDDKAQDDKKRYEEEMKEFNKEIDKVNIQTNDDAIDRIPGKAQMLWILLKSLFITKLYPFVSGILKIL